MSAAAHADATLVTPSLPDALPALIAKTEILKDLVRVVDLGPFKHTVDDGLDLRKAAFECLDTLLDACLHPTKNAGAMTRLGAAAGYLDALTSGLGDQYDVKMIAHAVLVKLCRGDAKRDARERLAALCEPMKKTLTAKLKSDAVKQEIDRNEDLIRSCLRAVVALSALEGAMDDAAFAGLIEKTIGGSDALTASFAAIKAETKAVEKGDV